MGLAVADVWFAFNVDPYSSSITDEDSWIKVTDYLRRVPNYRTASLSDRFAAFAAGGATIWLDNRTRRFDPLHSASPFAGWLNRNVATRITVRDGGTRHTIFYGYTKSWKPRFIGTHDATCVVTCTDGLGAQARAPFTGTIGGSGARAGTVIGDILDGETGTAGPPSALRDLDDGVTIQSHTVSGSKLSAIKTIVDSDVGWFFADRDGVLTFRDHNSVGSNSRMSTSQLTISDVTEPTYRYGPLEFSGVGDDHINTATITRDGGTAQTFAAAGAGDDGIPVRHDRTTQVGSDAEALALAQYIVDWHSSPVSHPLSVKVRAGGLNGAVQALLDEAVFVLDTGAGGLVSPDQTRTAVNGLRLMDRVTIPLTPAYGDAISADCFVTGMSGEITPAEHIVTLQLASADAVDDNLAGPPSGWLILDDATRGKLGTGALGY